MTRILWDAAGTRRYEAGIDRGVLFVDGEPGVPWNGLTSLKHSTVDSEVRRFYNDGIKYIHNVTPGEYEAELAAYTYPTQFERCNGSLEIDRGLSLDSQVRKPFGLSYRTRIGNDTRGSDYGYRIHVVYNAFASPSNADFSTIGDTATPSTFAWHLTTLPVNFPGYLPSSHFTLNSRRASSRVMTQVETILYGSPTTTPRLPLPEELYEIFLLNNNPEDTFTEFFEAAF
jgi:hypothetical protein